MDLDTLLARVQRADLLRLATAGSVDDGKSTLIGRLIHDAQGLYDDQLAAVRTASTRSGQDTIDWALVTDGLKAEREQRITIDVAYRHFSTPRRRFIIADTPGHEQYTRNMATGASTADLAVILIDASHGVLTQSKRHGFITSLLGIPNLVVAVNKMDLVDWSQDVFEQIREEYLSWSAKLRVPAITFIPVSALLGDNVTQPSANLDWYDGPTLLGHLETVPLGSAQNLIDFRFPVQYVLRPTADFRGYAGTVASGNIRVGEEVLVLPSGRTSRVTQLLGPAGDQDHAFAQQAVAVCLADDLDLSRGDMIVRPGNQPWVAREIEAMLVWTDEAPQQSGATYILKHTTRLTRAQITEVVYRIDPNTLHRESVDHLALNEIGRVRLSAHQALMADEYTKNRATGAFILVDALTNATVAAGMVIRRQKTPSARPATDSASPVTDTDRARLLGQRPVTLWFTGLSGAGKSTIARALEARLLAMGHACMVLDGDEVRQGLNRDLGFSPTDRDENLRRLAEVAKLFCRAGLIVITAFISPTRADRSRAREILGSEQFVEVFVSTPLEECEKRDVKGLYARARAGQIPDFTGISAPYEAPEAADLTLPTVDTTVDELVDQAVQELRQRGHLQPPPT
ncbi:MAG TPA: adenylyl-sulfate kinase [Armatimonadetes bacterium]|nr:adenylyl-sulfate kinase [Armatimonadota bacterium]